MEPPVRNRGALALAPGSGERKRRGRFRRSEHPRIKRHLLAAIGIYRANAAQARRIVCARRLRAADPAGRHSLQNLLVRALRLGVIRCTGLATADGDFPRIVPKLIETRMVILISAALIVAIALFPATEHRHRERAAAAVIIVPAILIVVRSGNPAYLARLYPLGCQSARAALLGANRIDKRRDPPGNIKHRLSSRGASRGGGGGSRGSRGGSRGGGFYSSPRACTKDRAFLRFSTRTRPLALE